MLRIITVRTLYPDISEKTVAFQHILCVSIDLLPLRSYILHALNIRGAEDILTALVHKYCSAQIAYDIAFQPAFHSRHIGMLKKLGCIHIIFSRQNDVSSHILGVEPVLLIAEEIVEVAVGQYPRRIDIAVEPYPAAAYRIGTVAARLLVLDCGAERIC